MPRKPMRTRRKSRIPKEITENYLDDLEMRLGCSRFTVDNDELILAQERGIGSWMREGCNKRVNQSEKENIPKTEKNQEKE